MTKKRGTEEPGEYEVGYGKPPSRTKFRKGASGNPGGRPRGMTAGRAYQLALKEAFRRVKVREGGKTLIMPAFQAIIRSMIASAAKGSGPATRLFIEMVPTIERELAAQATIKAKAAADERPLSDLDAARRVAFLLTKAARESGQPNPNQPLLSVPTKKNRNP